MIRISDIETVPELMHSIIGALVDSGKVKIVSSNGVLTSSLNSDTRFCVLDYIDESLPPEMNAQPIRFKFEWNATQIYSWIATDCNLDEQGTIADVNGIQTGSINYSSDEPWFYRNYLPDQNETMPDEDVVQVLFQAHIAYTPYGLAIAVWDGATQNRGMGFSWFVIQRPVFPDGTPYVEDRAPTICVFASNSSVRQDVNYFIVRESDVNVPTRTQSACESTEDSVAFFNAFNQVAIAPSRKFCLFFPCGFNTQRYYYNLELDLIGYTSADVISMGSEIIDDRFGGKKRSYLTLCANGVHNTGMRFVLYNGEIE